MSKKNVLQGNTFKTGGDYLDRINAELAERESKLREIELNKVREKHNIRKQYEEINGLAESIKNQGLLQPIHVYKDDDGYFYILYGHRRYLAHIYLDKELPGQYSKISCIVHDKKEINFQELEEIQLIENIQKEDLKPIELKEALETLRGKGYSVKQIADKLGKGEGHVKNLFSWFNVAKEDVRIENLMKSNIDITIVDLQTVKILPMVHRFPLLEEKANGKIKSVRELQDRVFQIKEQIYEKDKSGREVRSSQGCFILGKNSLKVKLSEIETATAEQKTELLTKLKELIAKLEPSSTTKQEASK